MPTSHESGFDLGTQVEDLAKYHDSMLKLYQPEWVDVGQQLTVAALGTEECLLWQKAIAELPLDRQLLLGLGGELLRQGREGEAMALYRWLPKAFPEDPLMLHNLGVILQGGGDLLEAEVWVQRALEMDPYRQDTILTMAQLISTRSPAKARVLLRRLDPKGPQDFIGRLLVLGLDLSEHPNNARALVDELLPITEQDPDRFGSLLAVLVGRGHLDLGLELASKGPAQTKPYFWNLWVLQHLSPDLAMGQTAAQDLRKQIEMNHGNDPIVRLALGSLDRTTGHFTQAENQFRQVLELGGDRAGACDQLARVLFSLGRLKEAKEMMNESLRLIPLQANSHITRGLLAFGLGDPHESLAWFRTGLRLTQRNSQGYYTLGNIIRLGGDLVAANAMFEEALHRCPDDASIRTDMGKALLQLGDYQEGWKAYEARIHPSVVPLVPPVGMPRWDGHSRLDELVIVAEQGVGDVVQFIRYIPFLGMAIPRISIVANAHLMTLLRHTKLFSEVYARGDIVHFTGEAAWFPLLSIPRLLNISPNLVLIESPYLLPQAKASARWALHLRKGIKPSQQLIGLHWQGNPTTEVSTLAGRSFPLETFAPLTDLSEVLFVSLQKGVGSDQMSSCTFRDRFVAAQPSVDACWDFVETTGILEACDLVITSDSGLAHLAGALGRPVWLLLQHIPEWRWGLEGNRSHWYNNMRLFRQPKSGDWNSVVDSVREALQNYLKGENV